MSADSLETRVTKNEADIRRLESVIEPRFARIEEALKHVATKADLAEAIGTVRSELHQEIGGLRGEIHKEFTNLAEKMAAQTNRFLGYTLGFISVMATLAVAVVRILQPS